MYIHAKHLHFKLNWMKGAHQTYTIRLGPNSHVSSARASPPKVGWCCGSTGIGSLFAHTSASAAGWYSQPRVWLTGNKKPQCVQLIMVDFQVLNFHMLPTTCVPAASTPQKSPEANPFSRTKQSTRQLYVERPRHLHQNSAAPCVERWRLGKCPGCSSLIQSMAWVPTPWSGRSTARHWQSIRNQTWTLGPCWIPSIKSSDHAYINHGIWDNIT